MKNLLQKTWFTGLISMAFVLVVFLVNLWIMSIELVWPFDSDNFLYLPMFQFEEGLTYIFAFILKIAFFVTIAPIALAAWSFFRKKNWGFLTGSLIYLGFSITLIAFQAVTGYLPVFASVLNIINIVFILCILVLVILRNKTLIPTVKEENKDIKINLNNSKIPLLVILVDVITIVMYLTTFFIPLYTEVKPGLDYNAVLINVMFGEEDSIAIISAFFVNFLIFLGIFLYFADSISTFIVSKERFLKKSKSLVIFGFIATSIFFLAGLVIDIIYTIRWDMNITSISYIPLLGMAVMVLFHAILRGRYKGQIYVSETGQKRRYAKSEPLFYVIILTAVTVLMLFLTIVKIDITSGAYTYNISLTGFALLRDYAGLDPGYRIVAFLLLVMLVSVGFTLVITITSYLSKSKVFHSLVKFSTIVNVFFVFIVAISGYYFQIARDINKAIILDMAHFYGYPITNTAGLDYAVGTDGIYALIASVIVLILMFARKAFDRDEFTLIEASLVDSSSSSTSTSPNQIEGESNIAFDPSYAFTELDSMKDEFASELERRKAMKPEEVSLNGLVNFVVEYAKNSRLHLSYTPEDIATFVAGLGAAKLTILQGMSGTGKTSLPKIFSEAIFGNCDIVEVESSWKDKNELLGYYNEFSLKYTPKKFTLALYKAALNQEIFTFILLDEMNLSRIEYYFSDFLSLMENEEDQREIKLVNIKLSRQEEDNEIEYRALENGHTLKVPANVWFIGTANRDESTFVISDKVYDRAHTMNFTKRAPKVRNYSDPIQKQYYDYETMKTLFSEAKEKGNFDAENSELIKSIETLLAPYNISFGNRILMQIEDFVNIYNECFKEDDVESEAIEKILLSKVVAKLEVKTIEDKEKLEQEFEKLGLHQCAEFIRHLDED